MQVQALLKQVPFFRQLTEEQLHDIWQTGSQTTLPSGEDVVRAGDLGDTMYVVLAGRVRIWRRDEHDLEAELGTLEAGAFFGELALLDRGPRSASVTTLTPCELFVLDRDAFQAALRRYGADIVFGVCAALAGRLRETFEKRFEKEFAEQRVRSEMELAQHRALSQLVAGVAHEVNTPLGTVNTAVSILKKELTSPDFTSLATGDRKLVFDDVFEAIDLMERNIQRAHKLIQDFKKVSVSQLSDTIGTMDLREVVEEIVNLFKASARQARLKVDIVDTLPDTARAWTGYHGFLSQVLLNLLGNVERYAYPRGVGGTVQLTLAADNDRTIPSFVITVRDWGKGIPPEDLSHVFDPFFTTGRSVGGSGLGLAIVRNLVNGPLQGSIALASEPGQGTTATLTFPQMIHVENDPKAMR